MKPGSKARDLHIENLGRRRAPTRRTAEAATARFFTTAGKLFGILYPIRPAQCLSYARPDALHSTVGGISVTKNAMNKWLFSPAFFFGCLCLVSFASDDFSLLRSERIGSLYISESADNAVKANSGNWKRGQEKFWAADAAYHQEWSLPGKGITLDMVSEKKEGPKEIAGITITAPSDLSTKQGIHIGSSTKEVEKAYKSHWDKENSQSNYFVAGSIYGGLVFHFKDGKVSEIFLGASAE